MSPIDRISTYADELTALRRDLHAHPELGFEEVRTAGIVADLLEKFGCEVHRGIGGTGVVGLLKGRTDNGRRIGLRADMDALPIEEETNLPYRSTYAGKMHACGHDGHTTMLLGAARYLAETRNFAGTVYVIFQPAEEQFGGGEMMVKEGLFERFPMDRVFGMHNWPSHPAGEFLWRNGPTMAAVASIEITVTGKGAHGAYPHNGVDPIVVAAAIVTALQSVVARNVDPLENAVLTIGQIESVAGLENVDAIAAVPGLDMLYVGPADLAISMGLAPRQNSDDPVLMAAVDRILAAARRAGLRTGMHGTTADYALQMIAKGFDLVTVTSDEALLAAGKAVRAKIP